MSLLSGLLTTDLRDSSGESSHCEMFQWTVHQKGGFKRDYHAAVAVGHTVYSFGGLCKRDETHMGQIDVHVFNTNTVSLLWEKLPQVVTAGEEVNDALEVVPSMRYGHTAVLIDDMIYIWGGRTFAGEYSDKHCNELYAFDVNTHTWFKPRISGNVPEARWQHSACVLGNDMYIYGGSGESGHNFSDIYKLDTTTMVWSLINTKGPMAPMEHSATIIGKKMFVFGGYNYFANNNCSVFDIETNCWEWEPTTAQLHPERRWGHSAFAYNGELYIFGGQNMYRHFDDFWRYNPRTLSWTKVESNEEGSPWAQGYFKGPMSRMCCCMVEDCIIFFGGHRSDELYILDLSPTLRSLCKLAASLEQSGLPHDSRLELEQSGLPHDSRLELEQSGLPHDSRLELEQSGLPHDSRLELEQSGLPHDSRLELAFMTTHNGDRKSPPRWFAAIQDFFKSIKASRKPQDVVYKRFQ